VHALGTLRDMSLALHFSKRKRKKKKLVCVPVKSEMYNSSLALGFSKRRVGDTSFALLFQSICNIGHLRCSRKLKTQIRLCCLSNTENTEIEGQSTPLVLDKNSVNDFSLS